MEIKKRVIVVGLGSIGKRHARLLLELDDLEVELCELSQSVLSTALDELGSIKSYTNFENAISTKPDIVWLCTPTQFHAEQSTTALNAGCHVFCEKPMSDSVENALRIKAAVDANDSIFNVGFMLHFMPAMKRLKEILTNGTLGNIIHIHARVGTYITLVNSLSRYQATQPGSLFLDYAHQPDIFYWLTGSIPTEISTVGINTGDLEFMSDPNAVTVTMRYAEPMIATLHLNYIQMPQRHEYEIVGDLGWALLDFETGVIKVGDRISQKLSSESFTYDRDDLYREQIAAFLSAIAGSREPETSARDGLVSTKICASAIESYRQNGKSIMLNQI